MRSLKHYLKLLSLYKPVRLLYRKLRRFPIHPLQTLPTKQGFNIVHLGSQNCGWSFVDDGTLQDCTIISAGVGEDASFDIEFAQKYNARVIAVDPTPRAVAHFNDITLNLGNSKKQSYSEHGNQPIEAYDLTGIAADRLILVQKALYNESTQLKFYQPTNPEHVSHSINNYQHDYRDDTPFSEVQSITLPELFAELGIEPRDVSLIKLDIEGAEIEVLSHCMSQGITPRQILVEFDELNLPSKRGYERVNSIHDILTQNGYVMIRTDGQADFLYLRTD